MSYKPSSSKGFVLSSKDIVPQSQPGSRSKSNAPQILHNYETRYTLPAPPYHHTPSGHKAIDQNISGRNDKQVAQRSPHDLVEVPSPSATPEAPKAVSAGYRIRRVHKSKDSSAAPARSVAPQPSHEAIVPQSPPNPDSAVATRPSLDIATNPSPAVPAFAIPTNLLAFMPNMGNSLNLGALNAAKQAEHNELRRAKQATREMETALVRQTHIMNLTAKEQEHRERELAAREKIRDQWHVTNLARGAALGNTMSDLIDIDTREMEEEAERIAEEEEEKRQRIKEKELEEKKQRAQERHERKRRGREEARRLREWERHEENNRQHERDQDVRIAKEKREFHERHEQRALERDIRYNQVPPKVIEQGIDYDSDGGERPYLRVSKAHESQGRLGAPHRAGLLRDGRERCHDDPSRSGRKGGESGSRRHRSRSIERREPSRHAGSHGYRKTIR